LGELGDEIYSKHNVKDSIQVFCGTGPKSYAYQLLNNPNIEVCRVKGITINYETSKKINLKAIKHILLDRDAPPITVTTKNCIRRDMTTKQIKSQDVTKSYRYTNNKRIRIPGSFNTLPYGHKDVSEKTS
jgi:hypothetical protein